ncbi:MULTISPECIES: UPF0149 family protein [unclassified Mameliella]|uniref:UPF0149 family protein n=1 Tax=unclassified Mameliella TaxID=2630630 RepID=UPI00273D94EA|nr:MULTISPECIES: UPF0149 family protein [unclassified Mameliella]
MDQSDQELESLSALLHALPVENMPMTLSELDGYIVGVLACPEMIPPSDWLPHVWGETGEAEFPDQQSAEDTIGAVMAHYNSVVEAIAGSLWVEPIYEVDPNSDDVMWELWVDGFTRAMRLRPDAWSRLLDQASEEARAKMIFLMALQDIYTGQSNFTDDEIDEIDREAPDQIPNCVATILCQSRPELSQREPANLPDMPFKASPRPRRNDPCSCGSGLKYKRCCGRN